MKTLLSAVVLCAVAGAAFCDEPAKLEVHEWGTFTIVSGSDGMPLRWYQPQQSLAELPPFVRHNLLVAGKTGTGTLRFGTGGVSYAGGSSQGGDLVRMETPVIYFYPEKPMMVTVSAQLKSGRITEWFPSAVISSPFSQETKAEWVGSLLAPDDSDAAKMIPKVEGAKGAHYAHAREVPAAWYFRGSTCTPPNQALPYEKFIFYRGAGDAIPPLEAHAFENGRMKIYRFDQDGPPLAVFALQVQGMQARWMRMPDLTVRGRDGMSPAPISEATLGKELQPVAEVAAHLGEAMIKDLTAAGLSADEAKAMVATWSDAWFQENGSRILALLPRPWVNSVLPLTITPQPQKLTRVFVGRFEMFTAEQEHTLLTLLQSREQMDGSMVEQFRRLRLGRFANAALQRTKNLLEQGVDLQFQELMKAGALQPSTASR